MMMNEILKKIEESEKEFLLIAIDGRCGAGKTTLAKELQKILFCNVIHMDNFFLRPEQRSEERLKTPGENVDHERFLSEVLMPLSKNEGFSYRPYSCKTGAFSESVDVKPSRITVIEGSYSCHPKLWDYYDIHIFMDIDRKAQLKRITLRNGADTVKVFLNKWIPLEESYFNTFSVKERCELKYFAEL